LSQPTLKQFGELSLDDFDTSSVWVQCHVIDYDEPWYEDTDEETFRPWDRAIPVDPDNAATFLVRAAFELAGGSSPLPGFVTPQAADPVDLGTMQPHIFTPRGRLGSFWLGMFGEPDADFYHTLLEISAPVFPIRFSALPGLSLGLAAGVLEGFYRWSENGGVLVPSPS
jgi:hypothetical protein